jgi:hypothetical protein
MLYYFQSDVKRFIRMNRNRIIEYKRIPVVVAYVPAFARQSSVSGNSKDMRSLSSGRKSPTKTFPGSCFCFCPGIRRYWSCFIFYPRHSHNGVVRYSGSFTAFGFGQIFDVKPVVTGITPLFNVRKDVSAANVNVSTSGQFANALASIKQNVYF